MHIKPILDKLKDEKLLQLFLKGFNQNAAESFNNVLWHMCPKSKFVGSVPFKVCPSLAVVLYNDGYMQLDSLFDKLGIMCGLNTLKEFQRRDIIRINKYEYKSSAKQRKTRQATRKKRLVEEDRNEESEGILV